MSTITVRLLGGLGNQMFQYAAARALAIRRAAALELDLSSYATDTLRCYELGNYPIVARIAETPAAPPLTLAARKPFFLRGLDKVLAPLAAALPTGTQQGRLHHYREPQFRFDEALERQPLPLLMDGYWQSERYFADAAATIRQEFTPAAPLEPGNAEISAQIKASEAVSIHVRRGDYVTSAHTNSYHGICSLDYYERAIERVRAEVAHPHLFVFSDDQEWTRANLKSDLPTTYVTANPADRGYRDMQLMSHCRHHIIANSSFSWWGAWLNPRPDKIVVAPERWFATAGNDTRDLLPDTWIRQ